MRQWSCIFILSVLLAVTGCAKKEPERGKKTVEYAVCRQSVIPKELKTLIYQEKKETFHFTYSTRDYTYFVVGYGEQPGKGYKIKVKEFTMDKDHIYIDTTLIGVTKEHQKEGTSYPYLVLKSQYYEKETVFR